MAEISTTRIITFKDTSAQDIELRIEGDSAFVEHPDSNGVVVPLSEITQFAELLLSWASTGGRST